MIFEKRVDLAHHENLDFIYEFEFPGDRINYFINLTLFRVDEKDDRVIKTVFMLIHS